jgi:hypothetical protein
LADGVDIPCPEWDAFSLITFPSVCDYGTAHDPCPVAGESVNQSHRAA